MERENEWSPDPLPLCPVPPKTEEVPPKGETTVLPFGACFCEPLVFAEPGVARFDLGVGSPRGVRGGVDVLCTCGRLPFFAGEGDVSIWVEPRACPFVDGETSNGTGSVTVR